MKTLLTATALCLLLSGCAAQQYQSEHYQTPTLEITTKRGTFVIQHNEKEHKLLVRPDFGGALAGTPAPYIKEAAQAYIDKTNRKCHITESALISEPFHEFSYSCQ